MGETEITIFTVIISLILLVFIGGIIVFFLKYTQRKLISEKEKALLREQHAQELLSSKLEMQQLTMQDIGREIHDNIGQLLTVASISAYQVAYDNVCPEVNDRVTDVGKIIDRSLAELRSLSRSLTDEKAEMADFLLQIQKECDRINALQICVATCTCNENDFTIFSSSKNFMQRIIQEFIQNSLKHAECNKIEIRFFYGALGLSMYLQDDGKGFDTKAVKNKEGHGIGLKNMKKRSEMIGADFLLDSVINEGTTVGILIPLNRLNLS